MLGDCTCEFDYPPDPDDPEGESFHYTRTCLGCGRVWGSLHCEHDGIQRRCPECGWLNPGTQTPMQAIGAEGDNGP